MGIVHSKASVDISTTPKAAEPAVKVVTKEGDVQKDGNAEVEVKCDTDVDAKDEAAGHLKPELLDVKESRVASLKRNLSFSKMKKMFSRGEAAGAEVETKEVADDVKVEVKTSDEVGDANKDEAKEEVENKEVPEEKSAAAEGDSKVTEWKNSLFKMFSRESSSDNEVVAAASSKKEGTEGEQEVEGAGDGLKTEEGLEEKKAEGESKTEKGLKEKAEGGESKMTNLKKRLSFKAIKSRFTKEKKEEKEEEVTSEKKNEEGDFKEEVKTDGNDEEAIKVASDDDGAKEMEPPTETPPAVPVQPVSEEDANAKNAQPGEARSEDDTLGEIETPNADNPDTAVEGAVESLVAKTS